MPTWAQRKKTSGLIQDDDGFGEQCGVQWRAAQSEKTHEGMSCVVLGKAQELSLANWPRAARLTDGKWTDETQARHQVVRVLFVILDSANPRLTKRLAGIHRRMPNGKWPAPGGEATAFRKLCGPIVKHKVM